MLLQERERARIKGVIINKFRGDVAILKPGLEQIEALTQIPVIGVIPYMMDLQLDEEDSATEFNRSTTGAIDICVVKLPRISNFTDFDAFRFDRDVSVRYVMSPSEIGNADVLVLPGSKNTIEDLRWLKQAGFGDALHRFPGIVFGLCGGYQMLGEQIVDKEGWEVNPGEREEGLGVFATTTVFEGEKITTNVAGKAFHDNIYGYEIHSGRTIGNTKPFVQVTTKEGNAVDYTDGDVRNQRFYGTYIHGIFDSGEFRSSLLNRIRRKKGLRECPACDLRQQREAELEKLAHTVRENLDMELVYSLIRKNYKD
jgi:adenosylcobyric acid synthase